MIGASQGGINAWKQLLPELAEDIQVPIILVQHQKSNGTSSLASFIKSFSALPVNDAMDAMPLQAGEIYVAPANYHLLVNADKTLLLDVSAPVQFSRPSINVTLMSALSVFGQHLAAVQLTGANRDGAHGIQLVQKAGGKTIVQDPNSAESPQMPRSALSLCKPSFVLPLESIAKKINQLARNTCKNSHEMESTL